MKTRLWIVALGVIVASAALLAFGPAVMAQGPGNGTCQSGGACVGSGQAGAGPMQGAGGSDSALIDVAAQELDMSRAELLARLQDGTTTVADVAREKNVSVGTIAGAFIATRVERWQVAVAAGRLTQEQADQMQATVSGRVTARLTSTWTDATRFDPLGGAERGAGSAICDGSGAGMGGQGQMRGQGRWNR